MEPALRVHVTAKGFKAVGSATFPVLLVAVQKFLSGASEDVNRLVGAPLLLSVDAARFKPEVRRYFLEAQAVQGAGQAPGLQDRGTQAGTVAGEQLTFAFYETQKPGLYLFDLFDAGAGPEAKPEQRAFVFNVDTVAEGELKRAPREDLQRRAEALVQALAGLHVGASVGTGEGQIGGGTMPKTTIPSVTLDLLPKRRPLEDFSARLRLGEPPVVGYIAGGRFKLDLRTIFPRQDGEVVGAVRAAL